MFRSTKIDEVNPKHFGVGSIVDGDVEGKWLVMCTSPGRIGLLNMKTFTVDWSGIEVVDASYLTEVEARKLIDVTVGSKLHWTFTDFTLNTKGLK